VLRVEETDIQHLSCPPYRYCRPSPRPALQLHTAGPLHLLPPRPSPWRLLPSALPPVHLGSPRASTTRTHTLPCAILLPGCWRYQRQCAPVRTGRQAGVQRRILLPALRSLASHSWKPLMVDVLILPAFQHLGSEIFCAHNSAPLKGMRHSRVILKKECRDEALRDSQKVCILMSAQSIARHSN
jgi:hypothetical protein